jgi:hydroxyquinol 1,2-dioxygenase
MNQMEERMRELTPETITDAVLDQMATTPDARMREVMASAVKHLHAFAREVNLTPAEWIRGIGFMTEVGKMCTPERQEFILLSDTLGLSALVNGLHDHTAIEEGTHTSLLGPFYRETSPKLAPGSQIARTVKPGSECALYGRVTDVNGKPLANASVSIWQTGADGLYDIQESATAVDYRGVFTTDADGMYLVRTVKPVGYSIPMDGPVGGMVKAQGRHGMRPAHIHFLVGAPGYRELVTALYLRDDPHLADDVVFGSSGDLAVDLDANDPGCPIKGLPSIRFDLRLSREGAADKTSGRVGSDPAAIMKPPAKAGNGQSPAAAAS